MNCDGIHASGDDTLVNVEIEGIWRRVTLTRGAIGQYLSLTPQAALAMSADQRCDFVRSNLAYVFAAARRRVRTNSDTRRIVIRSGEL